ncbi:long-chain-fatty-acid--CoA ligase [Pseudaquidulcibacter saccharophilus]|uniref:long-chain-fatty-acid--CoA ligase n=1 Tax=Pseudaquidulcibacter saccharophilus TaxID=2831900 RepID=UPI001EFEF597|nr:long-chain-fatty-acid--CoA ligase [Pseudaquidulcibacter saccharophilus]
MERIWVKNYPEGVAADIDISKYPSLPHLFADIFNKYSSRTAFISMDKAISFNELEVLSNHFGGWLQSLGLKKGARVAIMMPNILQYPIAIAGVLRAGCVVVNCNPLYTPRELLHQLNDSEADAIIVLENFAHTLAEVIDNTKVKHVIVTSIGEVLGGIKGLLTNFVVRNIKKMVPAWSINGAIDLKTALAIGKKRGFKLADDLTHEDIAFLQYTGGTTGVSKGAMLTHKNIIANAMQAHEWVKPLAKDCDNFGLTALPLYHIFALTANCMLNMMLGSPNLLIANPRDIEGLVKDWAKYPVTSMTGVNTLFNALLHNEKFKAMDFSKLRISLGGGMAVQSVVAENWKEVTGTTLIQAYGLTETSPAATINPFTMKEFNGSIGLPISSTEIAIRDDAGNDMPIGQSGEICVRGPQVMKGYWQRPQETEQVMFKDGFLRTGDVGFMDKDGFVYLVDRKKDTIIVSGFNVYPNEIEEAVSRIPGVVMVAAVGVPDERSGEAVKVFVVKNKPELTEKDIIQHCREELTGYKVPRHVEFRDDLPKSDVGKVLRRALK